LLVHNTINDTFVKFPFHVVDCRGDPLREIVVGKQSIVRDGRDGLRRGGWFCNEDHGVFKIFDLVSLAALRVVDAKILNAAVLCELEVLTACNHLQVIVDVKYSLVACINLLVGFALEPDSDELGVIFGPLIDMTDRCALDEFDYGSHKAGVDLIFEYGDHLIMGL